MGHLGGATGGTTAFLITLPLPIPRKEQSTHYSEIQSRNQIASQLPHIAVAVLTNLENASGIGALALQLSDVFTSAIVDTILES